MLRIDAREGRLPLGIVFGGLGLLGGLMVTVFHLDRLPVTFCSFKAMTGLPCPTCGSTRALGRLVSLDWAGALAMNPVAVVAAVLIAVWALAELLLLPRRRALVLVLHPRLATGVRVAVVALFLANWVYLLAVAR